MINMSEFWQIVLISALVGIVQGLLAVAINNKRD